MNPYEEWLREREHKHWLDKQRTQPMGFFDQFNREQAIEVAAKIREHQRTRSESKPVAPGPRGKGVNPMSEVEDAQPAAGSGSGKTASVRAAFTAASTAGWEVSVFDPGGEFVSHDTPSRAHLRQPILAESVDRSSQPRRSPAVEDGEEE